VKYRHFEALALVIGTIAIAASLFMAPSVSPQAAEVAAQLLLIVVLAGALHWGRNGGFIVALISIVVYVAMRYPLLVSQGLSTDLLTMLGTRAATYAAVGLLGGEVASRIKYVFARLENDTLVDHLTGAYSARYAAEAIVSGVGQWDRYRMEFSVVEMRADSSAFAALKPARYRNVTRQAASRIRNDVRMVDDLAFNPPCTFLVLLPGTNEAGAGVVAQRLLPGVAEALGTAQSSITVNVRSAAESSSELLELARSMYPNVCEAEDATPAVERRGRAGVEAQETVA
jgi:GGDEF domain-containing protein